MYQFLIIAYLFTLKRFRNLASKEIRKSNNLIYSEEIEKNNILNNYFTEQTPLDERQASLPSTMTTPTYKLDSLSVTPEEVEQTLKLRALGKAAGHDLVNNRLLKELAQPLSLPLCDLFNFSLSC